MLESWIKAVLEERERILARIGPVPPRQATDQAVADALYRAAAALIEWQTYNQGRPDDT